MGAIRERVSGLGHRGEGVAVRQGKKLAWRGLHLLIGGVATVVTRKVLVAAWSGFGEGDPPDDPSDRRASFGPALGWAIATGVGVGVARFIALRSAAVVWESAVGEPPPIDT